MPFGLRRAPEPCLSTWTKRVSRYIFQIRIVIHPLSFLFLNIKICCLFLLEVSLKTILEMLLLNKKGKKKLLERSMYKRSWKRLYEILMTEVNGRLGHGQASSDIVDEWLRKDEVVQHFVRYLKSSSSISLFLNETVVRTPIALTEPARKKSKHWEYWYDDSLLVRKRRLYLAIYNCKFKNICKNFIYPNIVKRYICVVKNRDWSMIYQHK